jgi:2-iminobutanoate/2-iminopropanoate deaminase
MSTSTPIGPVGPYTPIVRAGPWLICSGQLGLHRPPDTSRSGDKVDGTPVLVEGGPAAQMAQALSNAEGLLSENGATLEQVVKTTVFVTDPVHFPVVNEAYTAFFGDHRPARSMVAVVALPAGAAVEVEVWAYAPTSPGG